MIYRLRVILILVIFSLIACGGEEVHNPFPEDKTITLLKDIHIVNGILQRHTGEVKDSLTEIYYDQLFTIHGIDKKELDKLLLYIESNPEDSKRLYEKVLEELTFENEDE